MIIIDEAWGCSCGAVIVTIDGIEYYMSDATWDLNFEGNDIENEDNLYHNCNHCTNNWGVDLCACGSGEKPSECTENIPAGNTGAWLGSQTFEGCGTPQQEAPNELTVSN